MKSVAITAADLLDGARTLRTGRISTCDWLPAWTPATTFLEWAKRGLQEPDAYGLSNATSYAKTPVACRIDWLLQCNYLAPFFRANYPAKIDALQEIGLSIPRVVYELVIEPRNELDHRYEIPGQDAARHAVGIAELFLRATDAECERSPIVAVNWNVIGGSTSSELGGERVQFDEFSKSIGPMLFLDVFDDPHAVKIVDPASAETRSAEIPSLSCKEAVQLANILRKNYASGYSSSGSGPHFYREMKRLGGF